MDVRHTVPEETCCTRLRGLLRMAQGLREIVSRQANRAKWTLSSPKNSMQHPLRGHKHVLPTAHTHISRRDTVLSVTPLSAASAAHDFTPSYTTL